MEKTEDAFRTIGEVAENLDLPQHVLRFWETKFTHISPVKRAGGRRYYRPEDVQLVSAIRILLYSEGYTIRGVQRILKEQGPRAVIAASRTPGRGALAGAAPAESGLAEAESPVGDSASPALLEGATALAPQDRHRLEAVLVELSEVSRLLENVRRG